MRGNPVSSDARKLVCISIPCYNEVNNVEPMAEELIKMFDEQLSRYRLQIQFIDNNSNDGTQDKIRQICAKHPQVRAILNARNFPMTSGYYGMLQAVGDCTVAIPCDFQVPLDTIPQMIDKWEKGAKIVCLVKQSADEIGLMWKIRQLFYKLSNRFSDVTMIRNYNGSGLYDKSFMDLCRRLDDPVVSFLQIVSTLGYDIEYQEYVHAKRRSGKSKNGPISLLNMAITRFTNSSTIGPRIATIVGFIIGFISILIGLIYLILKLVFWDRFDAGMAPIIIGVFFMGGIQLFFIGLLGEYILKANKRLMRRPLVIERERINFTEQETNQDEDDRGDPERPDHRLPDAGSL